MDETLIGEKGDRFYLVVSIICLRVFIENLPDTISVFGHKLKKRVEFHVSLVCMGQLLMQYGINVPDFEQKVLEDFTEFIKQREIKLLSYTNEFRFLERVGRNL